MFYEVGVTSADGSELSIQGAGVCQGKGSEELLCLEFPQKHFCADLWPPWSVISLWKKMETLCQIG